MDKMRKIIIIYGILIIGVCLFSQNTMFIPDVVGNAEDTVSVSVHISNADNFVAIQTDIQLPAEVSYVANSGVLTARSQGHILSISLWEDNLLRVFIYSLSNSTFLGNTGSVLDFQVTLGTVPGNYQMELVNPIIGNAGSQNIITGYTNGNLTLFAPDISLNVGSLNFGEVPLTSHIDRSLTISNPGNSLLEISRIYTDNAYFVVLDDTTLTIPAGNSTSITIRFYSLEKGNYQNRLFFLSNDPDESVISIPIQSIAFAINELHALNATGSSGYNTEVSFTINNMEAFVAFQFDLILPVILSYIDNSIALSTRSVDHVVTAHIVQDDMLRVIAYSPSNTPFIGNEGDIVSFAGLVNGIGGSYPLNLVNVILSDQAGNNIVSEYYSGHISITAPDIQGLNSLNMGETPTTDTIFVNYLVSNTGNDTLLINELTSSSELFWFNALLPQSISPQQSVDFQVGFYCPDKGHYSSRLNIFSNDPDENPFPIDVVIDAFAPNYISVSNVYVTIANPTTLAINVDNYEDFVAIQADISVPSGFDYIQNSAVLTNRANGHILQVNEISANTIRVISFSMDQTPFWGNNGPVIELDFDANLSPGSYPLNIDNGILANSSSENILKDTFNGSLYVLQTPENVTIQIDAGYVIINWDSIPEASSYCVYSSEDPYLDHNLWYLEEEGILTNSWNESISDEKRFFMIKANY